MEKGIILVIPYGMLSQPKPDRHIFFALKIGDTNILDVKMRNVMLSRDICDVIIN